MIVVENTTPSPPKGSAGLSHSQAGKPPPYPAVPYPTMISPHPVRPYSVQDQIVYRQSPTRRFFRALVVALLMWFLFSIFVRSVVELVVQSRHGHWLKTGWFDTKDIPIPPGIDVGRCVSHSDWSNDISNVATDMEITTRPPYSFPYSAETSFDLALSSDVLLLLSRGSLSAGRVDVVTSPALSDVVRVQVVVNYFRKDIRDLAQACLIKRGDGENGVGIFSPRWWRHRSREDQLYFEVTVQIPKSANIKAFETDVPNMSHRVDVLPGKVHFDAISLKGSNAPIDVQSLNAERGNISTSNGPIRGYFETSKFLELKTSNAPIQVKVRVENKDKLPASELLMCTSNAVLESNINLVSATKSGGKYRVVAHTSNGPLNVEFPTSPVESTLDLEAKTSNSPAHVSLHPAYEGRFSLATSVFTPSIKRQGGIEDPSGKERERHLEYRTIRRGALDGSVYWSDSKGSKAEGYVAVTSSNSPVVLEL